MPAASPGAAEIRVASSLQTSLPAWVQGCAAGIVVALAFAAVVGLVFWRAQSAMIGEIHAGLARTARMTAPAIDMGQHAAFVEAAQYLSDEYQQAVEPLRRVLRADPEVAFSWTAVERESGIFFVLDASAPRPGDSEVAQDWVQIMEEFEDPPEELVLALRSGKGVVSQPYTDEWGSFISAFEPLRDADGKVVAVLGIDLRLTTYEARLEPVRRGSYVALALGFVIALLTGVAVWYSRKTDRTARELARQLRTVNALVEVSRALSAGVRLDDLVPVILERTREVMGASGSGLFQLESADLRLSYATPAAAALMSREAALAVLDTASSRDSSLGQRRTSGSVGSRGSTLSAPVARPDGQMLGVLQVLEKSDGEAFDNNDAVLIEALAGVLVMAFERARLTEAYVEKQKLDEALKLAASIQMSMVPSIFPAAGSRPVELHAVLVPAKEVGGDFYDFFPLPGGRLALVMADVSGKGMPAALFMAKAKTLVKAAALLIDAPSEILRRANDELSADNDAGMFVTLFLGILDCSTGHLEFSNAGHNPPLRLAGGKVSAIEDALGIALGAMDGLEYEQSSLQLLKGEALFLFTDGVNEAMNPAGQPWGNAAMESVVLNAEGSAKERNQGVLDALRLHADGEPQSDDITLMHLIWRGASG